VTKFRFSLLVVVLASAGVLANTWSAAGQPIPDPPPVTTPEVTVPPVPTVPTVPTVPEVTVPTLPTPPVTVPELPTPPVTVPNLPPRR
jgi:hypothetical protein